MRQGGKRTHGFEARDDVVQTLRALADHGFHLVGAVALVLQVAAQAVVQEVGDGGQVRFDRGDAVEAGGGNLQRVVDGERERLLDQHAQDAQRVAAQRERVFLARGLQANAPDADQRFQLVRQCHHGAGSSRGQSIACKARLVVLGAGQRHIVGFTIVAGVVRAHRALQLGELAHHVGQQIGLGEQRTARSVCDIRAELFRQLASDGLQARHALKLRADLVVIDHTREQRHAVGQRLLLVLFEEEAGIGQARAHHALVALDDGHRRASGDVRDDQKAVTQMALGIRQRKVLLVRLHGQDQALLRHGEERFLEVAGVDHGPFDQRVDFVQQRFGHHHGIGAGGLEQFSADGFLALAVVGDDLARGVVDEAGV